MQHLLTQTINFTAIISIVLFMLMLWVGPTPQAQPIPELGPELEGDAIMAKISECLGDKPAPQLATINFNDCKVAQLRTMCSDRGIQWRNLRGPNKHALKSQMVEALWQS